MPAECARMVVALHDLVDGRLSPERADRLQRHLNGCPACTAAVSELRALREQLAWVEVAPALPSGFEARLARRLWAARPERRVRLWWVAGPVLGAALGGFLGAVLLMRPGPLPTTPSSDAHVNSTAGAAASPAATMHAPTLTQAPTVASTQVAGLSPPTQGVPDAEALTLVARSPEAAMVGLSRLAAADGGQALATPAALPVAPTGRQVAATLEAALPPASLAGFAAEAARYGTVVAQVSTPATTTQPDVQVLVTVLTPTPAPASPAATITVRGWRARLLRAVGAYWEVVAGAAVAVVLVALVINGSRQGRDS